jgi:hypothetical protein
MHAATWACRHTPANAACCRRSGDLARRNLSRCHRRLSVLRRTLARQTGGARADMQPLVYSDSRRAHSHSALGKPVGPGTYPAILSVPARLCT